MVAHSPSAPGQQICGLEPAGFIRESPRGSVEGPFTVDSLSIWEASARKRAMRIFQMTPKTSTPDKPLRRRLLLSKIHIGLAAIGTLSSVVGIGVAIDGGLEFNRTKVFVGVGIIVASTILYISMLFVPDVE